MPANNRIKRFHAALRAAQLTEHKRTMVSAYGVDSTKKLTDEQLDELIEHVESRIPAKNEVPRAVRKARHKILNLLTDLGVMKHANDWDSVNAYLKQPTILGKRLNQTEDLDELGSLDRKLRKLKRDRDRLLDEERYLVTNN
jgi:hypothetical protein